MKYCPYCFVKCPIFLFKIILLFLLESVGDLYYIFSNRTTNKFLFPSCTKSSHSTCRQRICRVTWYHHCLLSVREGDRAQCTANSFYLLECLWLHAVITILSLITAALHAVLSSLSFFYFIIFTMCNNQS